MADLFQGDAEAEPYMENFDFNALYGSGGQQSPNGEPGDVALPSGGLTLEQEDALFETGVIPPPVTGDKVTDDLASAAAGDAISLEPRAIHTPPPTTAPGHKFDLPVLPLPPGSHLKFRYHPVLHQFQNLLMRHGKLSAAQRVRTTTPIPNRLVSTTRTHTHTHTHTHTQDTPGQHRLD
jgi:hypothetical protein